MKQREKLIEKQLNAVIKSHPLVDFKLFQVNENYFELPEKNQWIIDGGIELSFPYSVFSIGRNQDVDSFTFEKKKFEDIYSEDNFVELNSGNISRLKKLINIKISEIEYKWIEYDVIVDYTMATEKESRLVELKVKFESNDVIHLATVDYELEENDSPKDFSYDINGEILIALNNADLKINNVR